MLHARLAIQTAVIRFPVFLAAFRTDFVILVFTALQLNDLGQAFIYSDDLVPDSENPERNKKRHDSNNKKEEVKNHHQ